MNYALFSLSHVICSRADFVGYTAPHLDYRIVEHKNSAIGKHQKLVGN